MFCSFSLLPPPSLLSPFFFIRYLVFTSKLLVTYETLPCGAVFHFPSLGLPVATYLYTPMKKKTTLHVPASRAQRFLVHQMSNSVLLSSSSSGVNCETPVHLGNRAITTYLRLALAHSGHLPLSAGDTLSSLDSYLADLNQQISYYPAWVPLIKELTQSPLSSASLAEAAPRLRTGLSSAPRAHFRAA